MNHTQALAGRLPARWVMPEAPPLTAEILHAEHLPHVFRYVSRRVPRREEAEDITAEVFAAAFQALSRGQPRGAPLPWLLGIARRKIADAIRRQAARPEALTSDLLEPTQEYEALLETLSPTSEAADASLHRGERRRMLRSIIASLKEEQREALLLHYLEGLPIADVAAVMGRSRGAVNSLLQRARASLYRLGEEYFTQAGF